MSRIVHTNIARVAQNEANADDILSYFAADRNITQTTSTAANCQTPSSHPKVHRGRKIRRSMKPQGLTHVCIRLSRFVEP